MTAHEPPPDFLVIGAAKSGTTALDECLRQHLQLYLPHVREPNFFAASSISDLRDHLGRPAAITHNTVTVARAYDALFAPAREHQLRGETSPAYLYDAQAPDRIAVRRQDVRLVAILRDPVERAWSAYQHLVREGREPLGPIDALEAEPRRIAQGWGHLWRYVDMGRYHEQLSRYLDRFPRDQLLVILYEDFQRDPQTSCDLVFEFLGVEAIAVETGGRYNVSGVPRRDGLQRIINPPARARRAVTRFLPRPLTDRIRQLHARLSSWNLERAPMPPDFEQRLQREFDDEVSRLEGLLRLDLSTWHRESGPAP